MQILLAAITLTHLMCLPTATAFTVTSPTTVIRQQALTRSSLSMSQKNGSDYLNSFGSIFKKPDKLDAVDTMERKIVDVIVKSDVPAEVVKPVPAPAPVEEKNSNFFESLKMKLNLGGPDPNKDPSATDKFTFGQRIESVKTGVVGLLAGGIALAPIAGIHDVLYPGQTISNGLAQWEFDTDTGSIDAALFAIVYRYCVREGEEQNEMLPMGVIGAFVIVRTLSRVRVSSYCDAVPLNCGAPLGYFDWSMIQQTAFSGLESVFLFGATAAAMEYCYTKAYISRFK